MRRRRTQLTIALLMPAALAAQSPAPQTPADGIMLSFEHYADLYGNRLVADGNYLLCDRFGDLKHSATAKDSLADVVKARWPKDTLVARQVAFTRDAGGVVTGLMLHQNGRDMPARKVQ